MKYFIAFLIVVFIIAAGFFFMAKNSVYEISRVPAQASILEEPEAPPSTSTAQNTLSASRAKQMEDIGPQQPLANPPEEARGIYLTAWVAGSSRIDSIINFIKDRNLNAVVIDVKDYSGYVSYKMDAPGVQASGAESEIRIVAPNTLIKKLHDNGIYVIARITVFQDPILAKIHPEWALRNKKTGGTWYDRRGLAWMDPASRGTWDYTIAIAQDAISRGFDEVNFDYLRFPSDGVLSEIKYPFWDGKTARRKVIKNFFAYLKDHLASAKISADLFGLSTSSNDDLGIGQVIEDSYPYFDFVSPMVYPSHYATGYLGYKNPANYPYQVINYSMESAIKRLNGSSSVSSTDVVPSSAASTTEEIGPFKAKLRPWLQVFDLGAIYTPAMVNKEIQAVEDSFVSSTNDYAGWLMWDPRNLYSAYKG